jgi:hypothetical protein
MIKLYIDQTNSHWSLDADLICRHSLDTKHNEQKNVLLGSKSITEEEDDEISKPSQF